MQYLEIADATTYFESRLFTEPWDSATEENRDKALKHATRSIDKLSFDGYKTDPEQELEFPRNAETEIPVAILNACCEEALSLLSGKDPEEIADSLNVSSEGFVSVRTTYDTKIQKPWVIAGLMSKTAFEFLLPYFSDRGHVYVSRA